MKNALMRATVRILCGIHPMHFAKVTIFRKEICRGFQTQV